jgi:hypothetical protein
MGCPALGFKGKPIHILPAKPVKGGNEIRRDPLGHLKELFAKTKVVAVKPAVITPHRNSGHALHPCSHHKLMGTGHHAVGSKGDRLKTRTTEAVEGNPRNMFWPPRAEYGVLGDVGSLLLRLICTTHDHILDFAGIHPAPFHKFVQGLGKKLLRVNLGEGSFTLLSPPAGGANCFDNQCFTHSASLSFEVRESEI